MESQDLQARMRRLGAEAHLQSGGSETPSTGADSGGRAADAYSPQSWVNAAWSAGISNRQPDAGVASGAQRSGPATAPEQTGGNHGAGGLSNVTVPLDGENGRDGRLRVAVRGQSVHATIISEDSTLADRLGRNVEELHQALRERGFSEATVSVQRGQQEAPADRALHDTGSDREDEGHGEQEPDRRQGDTEDQAADKRQEHHESER
jgi:hypothetical protein